MFKLREWNDLRSRLISGLFLLCVSGICIYLGGYFFTLFLILLVGIMHWELGKMLSPMSKQAMWFSAIFSIISTFYLMGSQSPAWSLLILLVNFQFQKNFFHHNCNFGALYSVAVIICGIVFYKVRLDFVSKRFMQSIFHTFLKNIRKCLCAKSTTFTSKNLARFFSGIKQSCF